MNYGNITQFDLVKIGNAHPPDDNEQHKESKVFTLL